MLALTHSSNLVTLGALTLSLLVSVLFVAVLCSTSFPPPGGDKHAIWVRALVKRFFDLSFALTLLPVWLPVVLVVAMVVRWRLGSPILFRQTRPGLHGQPFEMIKFRSMTDARDAAGIVQDFGLGMQPRHLVVDDRDADGVLAAGDIAVQHVMGSLSFRYRAG